MRRSRAQSCSQWLTSHADLGQVPLSELAEQLRMRGLEVTSPKADDRRAIEARLLEFLYKEETMLAQNRPFIWRQCENLGALKPRARETVAAAVYKDTLYAFGGYAYGRRLNCLEKYSFVTKTWSELNLDNSPQERSWISAAVHEEAMYIFGGLGERKCFQDVYRFRFATERWEKLECRGIAPSARSKYDVCVYKNWLYVYGGKNWDENPLRDVFKLNLSTLEWIGVQTSGMWPESDEKDGCACQLVHNDSLVVFAKGSIFKLDLVTHCWSECATFGSPPKRRPNGTGVVLRGDSLFVFDQEASGDPPYTCFARLHQLCLLRMEWTTVRTYRYPAARLGATCVVHEDKMYCFGGSVGYNMEDYEYLNALQCMQLGDERPPAFQAQLLNQPQYSDVIFCCEGRRIYAHKAILAAQSEYFDHLFKYHALGTASARRQSLRSPSPLQKASVCISTNVVSTIVAATESMAASHVSPRALSVACSSARGKSHDKTASCATPTTLATVQRSFENVTTNIPSPSLTPDVCAHPKSRRQQRQTSSHDLLSSSLEGEALSPSTKGTSEDKGRLEVLSNGASDVAKPTDTFLSLLSPPQAAVNGSISAAVDVDAPHVSVIQVAGIQHHVFLTLMQYFYGCLQISPSDAVGLLVATDMYQLQDLKRKCVSIICEGLTADNVLSVLSVAEEHQERHLKRCCKSFINDHFLLVVESATFKDLCRARPELVQDLCRANALKGQRSSGPSASNNRASKRRRREFYPLKKYNSK